MRPTTPSILLFLLLAVAPTLTVLRGLPPPVPGEPVVVVAPPWRDAEALAQAAGGIPLAPGRLPFLALSYAPEGDHAAELRRAGAWAALPARLSSLLCGART